MSTRAAVYCRISRDLTGGNAGVDRQRAACLKLAADRGWTVDPQRVYIENDTSATKGRRPGYQTMLQAAETGAVDVIVAWHVDRLTRKLTELEHLIVLSERTGVRVATVSGDLDLTTDSGRLVGRILASVARGEVERKGARQKAANAQRADQGRPPTARAYGYAADGTVSSEEAAVVRTMFERFAAGAPITSILAALHRDEVPNSRGRPWGRSGVRDALLNPRYIGERWAHGEYVCAGTWEALVDPDTFAAVGARLRDPIRLHGHDGSARKHLGSGLYRCGVCADGTTMVSSWGSWRRRQREQVPDLQVLGGTGASAPQGSPDRRAGERGAHRPAARRGYHRAHGRRPRRCRCPRAAHRGQRAPRPLGFVGRRTGRRAADRPAGACRVAADHGQARRRGSETRRPRST